MQPVVRARLLGRFELSIGGAPVLLDSARAESLLAHLLLHAGSGRPRDRLAFLFWPGSAQAQARTNLRHVVHLLRTRVPDAARYLEVTPRTVGWRADVRADVDAARFERQLGEGDLEAAVGGYPGDLLEGLDDDWIAPERERLRARYLDALATLALGYEADGDPARALAHAETLRHRDPLREEAYRILMRAHAARGDRARALAAFHDCVSTLDRELGVEPAAQTRAVYTGLLAREAARAEPRPASAVPPLIGREQERRQLGDEWRAVTAGAGGRLVLLSGEPGIGKSRLAEEFRSWCARRGAGVADARCYAAEGPLAYGPVVTWLRAAPLRARLARLGRGHRTELARLLPELLTETPGLEPPAWLPAPEQRQRLFDAVAAAVLAGAEPTLLVLDDVQHAGRETCELLHYVLRVRPDARLLVLATARAEDLPGTPAHELVTALRALGAGPEIELGRLGAVQTAQLAAHLSGAALADDAARRLHRQTEGNPLFVVEAVRAGWTPGGPPSPRVQAVIETRLAQLPDGAHALAEAAAVIGREFTVTVLAAAIGVDPNEAGFVRDLDELWRRRIIREIDHEHGVGGYEFGHESIRDVAAAAVSPARRRHLHARIAPALAAAHAGDAGPAAVRIAMHYERGGAPGEAGAWYRRAAEAAQLLHANAQAIDLLRRALGQLRALPASLARDDAELALHTALLPPLAAVHGYAAPELLAAQRGAQALTSALSREATPALLRSLAMSAATGGDFAAATRIGHLIQAAGDRDGDNVLVVEGAFVLGIAAFWEARFAAAREHLELAVGRYRPAEQPLHLLHYGNDPKVSCLARLGNTYWFLGLPDEAASARAAALAWADEIGHGFSRGIALVFGALLALDMGDDDRVRADARELACLHGSIQLELGAAALGGYLAVRDGDRAGGVAAVRGAIERGRGSEAPGLQAMLHRILLAACEAAGDATGALDAADRLLGMGAGAPVWEAEARRVRAAFLEPAG